MDIRPTTFLYSILTAIASVLGLAVVVMGALFLGRGESAMEGGNDNPAVTNCLFAGTPAQLVLYHAPISAPSQEKVVVLGGEAFPIIAQNRGYYQLQLIDGSTGWVDSNLGALEGECDAIPVDETPLEEFPICTFATANEITLYNEAELVNAGGVAPPGTYVIESVSNDRYYIVDEQTLGWVAGTDGQISGDCDTLLG